MGKSKAKSNPELRIPFPSIGKDFNPTEYIGRKCFDKSYGTMGTIRSIDTGRKTVEVFFSNDNSNRANVSNVELFVATAKEISGIREALQEQIEELDEKLMFLQEKKTDILDEKLFKATKLVKLIKNADSDEKIEEILLSQDGF